MRLSEQLWYSINNEGPTKYNHYYEMYYAQMAMYHQPVTCQSLKMRLCLMRLSNIDAKHKPLATQTLLWPWKLFKRLFRLNAANCWWTTSNNGNGVWSSFRFTSLHSTPLHFTSLHFTHSLTLTSLIFQKKSMLHKIDYFRNARKAYSMSTANIRTSWVMLFRKMIGVYCEMWLTT